MLDGDTARRSVAGVPQYASGGPWGVGRGEGKKARSGREGAGGSRRWVFFALGGAHAAFTHSRREVDSAASS